MATDLNEKWKKDLEQILSELMLLWKGKVIWEGVKDIVDANTNVQNPGHFHRWASINHGITVAVGIRRQIDKDSRSRSLRNLLQDMRCNVNHILLDKAKHLSELNGSENEQELRNQIEKLLEKMIKKLDNKCKIIKKFVDKHVAHTDREGTRKVTIDQVHNALIEINEIMKDVSTLIDGSPINIETPIRDDWKDIFRVPWIESDSNG